MFERPPPTLTHTVSDLIEKTRLHRLLKSKANKILRCQEISTRILPELTFHSNINSPTVRVKI